LLPCFEQRQKTLDGFGEIAVKRQKETFFQVSL